MDLLAPGNALNSIRGKRRVAVVDYRPPLVSPVTVLVMFLKAAGFEWYGARKRQPDGSEATTCFIDTLTKYADGSEERKVVWSFEAEKAVDVGGCEVGIHALAHALGYSRFSGNRPLEGGAREVIQVILQSVDLRREMPFNDRGRALLHAAGTVSHREARLWLADVVELYRGFCWKLSTPADHPPHPDYGYPLDRHLRYKRGKRRGDVRQSIPYDQRMEELRQLGLR